MEAYKKYGFVKGTVLTTWRLCRCNPLGNNLTLLKKKRKRILEKSNELVYV